MKPKKHLHDRQVMDDFYDRQGNRCIAYNAGRITLCEERNIKARIVVYTKPYIYLVYVAADANEIDMRDWITDGFRQAVIDHLLSRFDIGETELSGMIWSEPSHQFHEAVTLEVA